jgi:hypothetical protein
MKPQKLSIVSQQVLHEIDTSLLKALIAEHRSICKPFSGNGYVMREQFSRGSCNTSPSPAMVT